MIIPELPRNRKEEGQRGSEPKVFKEFNSYLKALQSFIEIETLYLYILVLKSISPRRRERDTTLKNIALSSQIESLQIFSLVLKATLNL